MRSTPPYGSIRASPPLATPQSCKWPSGSGSSPMGSLEGQGPVTFCLSTNALHTCLLVWCCLYHNFISSQCLNNIPSLHTFNCGTRSLSVLKYDSRVGVFTNSHEFIRSVSSVGGNVDTVMREASTKQSFNSVII